MNSSEVDSSTPQPTEQIKHSRHIVPEAVEVDDDGGHARIVWDGPMIPLDNLMIVGLERQPQDGAEPLLRAEHRDLAANAAWIDRAPGRGDSR